MKRLLSVFLAMALFTPVVNSAFAGRHYDARIARFTTPDPVLNKSPKELLEEGQSAALSTSPYNYGLNNPVALVDPDGNFPVFFVAVAAAYLMTQYSGDHPGGSPSLATDAAVFGAALAPTAGISIYRTALAHPEATATIIGGLAGVSSSPSSQTIRNEVMAGANALKSTIHHIATVENKVSSFAGGPYTPKFQAIFEKAGVSMNDAINKVLVQGHRGPHPEANRFTYERLLKAVKGLKGEEYKKALEQELNALAKEAQTAGSELNKLLVGQ